MKATLAFLKFPKMIEYFEEVEFEEIHFFSSYFILKNGKKRKIIAHYWLVEEAEKMNKQSEDMEMKHCYSNFLNEKGEKIRDEKGKPLKKYHKHEPIYFYHVHRSVKKSSPIMTEENFDNLVKLIRTNDHVIEKAPDFED
jgi:hypothetical protein